MPVTDRIRCEMPGKSICTDTGVRGFVYEAAGTVDRTALARGAERVREALETIRLPVAIVDAPPDDVRDWTKRMRSAVGGLLG